MSLRFSNSSALPCLALCVLCCCDAGVPPACDAPPALAPPPMLATLADLPLDPDGVTAMIDMPIAPGSASLVLRLDLGPGPSGCVDLYSLTDGAGTLWENPPLALADRGAYCVSCPQRVSVGVGGGTY